MITNVSLMRRNCFSKRKVRNVKNRAKLGIAAGAVLVGLIAGNPLAANAAGTYDEWYNVSCSGSNVILNTVTKGNTQYYKNGSLWAYWYGNASAVYHGSNFLSSFVSLAQVQTTGPYAYYVSGYTSCG
jgi:hypothetical protein